jgi:exodeoxyribonuclease V alpha subunit
MNAAIPQRRPATEEISGLIERVTFHNDESGFCVLRVKARGQREETTVVGSLPSVTAGEWLSAEGWWVRDKEHGLQFKATSAKAVFGAVGESDGRRAITTTALGGTRKRTQPR